MGRRRGPQAVPFHGGKDIEVTCEGNAEAVAVLRDEDDNDIKRYAARLMRAGRDSVLTQTVTWSAVHVLQEEANGCLWMKSGFEVRDGKAAPALGMGHDKSI